jgi:hypothetical protein
MTELFEVALCKSLPINYKKTELDSFLRQYSTTWIFANPDQNDITGADACHALGYMVILVRDNIIVDFDQFKNLLKGVNTHNTKISRDFSDAFLRRIFTYVKRL